VFFVDVLVIIIFYYYFYFEIIIYIASILYNEIIHHTLNKEHTRAHTYNQTHSQSILAQILLYFGK